MIQRSFLVLSVVTQHSCVFTTARPACCGAARRTAATCGAFHGSGPLISMGSCAYFMDATLLGGGGAVLEAAASL